MFRSNPAFIPTSLLLNCRTHIPRGISLRTARTPLMFRNRGSLLKPQPMRSISPSQACARRTCQSPSRAVHCTSRARPQLRTSTWRLQGRCDCPPMQTWHQALIRPMPMGSSRHAWHDEQQTTWQQQTWAQDEECSGQEQQALGGQRGCCIRVRYDSSTRRIL